MSEHQAIPWPPFRYHDLVFSGITRDALSLSQSIAGWEACPQAFLDVAWVLSLLNDCAVSGSHDEMKGATYKALAYVGHLAGMDTAARSEWYKIAREVGITQRHVAHIIERIQDGTLGRSIQASPGGGASLAGETEDAGGGLG